MRDFSKVSPVLWQSERFNSLPSDDGRYLYLYLLTNEHQTSAGCYRLPCGYASTDLRWPAERYLGALNQLIAADLVHYDEAAHVIGITRWYKHNPPMSVSHLLGIQRQLERLPSEPISKEALKEAQEAWEASEAARAAKAARKPKSRGLSDTLGGQFPERLQTGFLSRGQ